MTTLEEIEKRADAIFESQKYCDIPISDLARLVRDLAIAVRERSTPELPAATVLGKAERDKWEEMVMAWRDYCGEAECIGELALTTGRAMIADLQKDLDWQAATTKALLEYQDEVASRIGKLEKARNAALARATKAEGTLGDAHGMLAGYVQRGMARGEAFDMAMTYFRDSDLAERLGNVRKSTVDGIVYGLTNLILSVADSQATECSVHASKRSPEKPKTSPVVAPQAVEHEVTVVGNVVKMNGQHVWTATMPGDPEVLKMNLELALKKGKPASEAAPVAK